MEVSVAGSAAGLFEPQAESRAQSKKMDAMRGFMDRLFIWIAKAFGNKSPPFYRFVSEYVKRFHNCVSSKCFTEIPDTVR